MRSDLTDITLVVDRSGSMHSIRDDAQGGVNALIHEQSTQEGNALITLVQFDNEYDILHRGTPVDDVGEYQLIARGSTALLDAVGRGINETGSRIREMPEAERPGLVVFVVMTDGHENSSQEFSRAKIREMVQHQQDVYGWKFTFLGADQDAFTEAENIGMARTSAAEFSRGNIGQAYAGTASKISRMRQQTRGGQDVVNEYTDEERKAME